MSANDPTQGEPTEGDPGRQDPGGQAPGGQGPSGPGPGGQGPGGQGPGGYRSGGDDGARAAARSNLELALWGAGVVGFFGAAAFAAWLVFLRSPVITEQIGYRGVAMEQPRFAADVAAAAASFEADQAQLAEWNDLNGVYDLVPDDGSAPRASEIYENVQVLGHLSDENFNRIMAQITAWVAPNVEDPTQGCAYCHADENGDIINFAGDYNYAKVVSRRMFQMTQTINSEWAVHVGETGVNCYTCHRGMNVPEYLWFEDPETERSRSDPRFIGERNGQNRPVAANAYSDLNADPFSRYMLNYDSVRGQHSVPITTDPNPPLQDTEHTYALMMHWSSALGVNCTYCHNSRNFGSWEQSPPQRTTAWHGRRMSAILNTEYLEPLQPVYPAHRLGALGDAPKLNCATCHQGVNKPLNGMDMRTGFPSLQEPGPADLQDAATWPTMGGEAPEGYPETGRYVSPDEQAAAPSANRPTDLATAE